MLSLQKIYMATCISVSRFMAYVLTTEDVQARWMDETPHTVKLPNLKRMQVQRRTWRTFLNVKSPVISLYAI